MRAKPAIAVLGVVLWVSIAGGCQNSGDWSPTLVPVDSGGGIAVDVDTELAVGTPPIRVPRMSWSPDGASLRVAGPEVSRSPAQSSLWSVELTTRAVTTTVTMLMSDAFQAAACYPGTGVCDLILGSGRILRRSANGDTATVLAKTLNGFYSSENGRFFLYTESDEKMRLLDASTGLKQMLTLRDLTKFLEKVAVSNDGAEVDEVAEGAKSITRHRIADGSSTSWTFPDEPGWQDGRIRELQWVGGTLYALVEWRAVADLHFVQYAVGEGAGTVLGTISKGMNEGSPWITWRPELSRMLAETVSAREADPDFLTTHFDVRQHELELLHGGVATRVARSGSGFHNTVMSPDGRTAAYGSRLIVVKSLPE